MPAAYLKISGVEGSCQDDGFEGTIDVISFGHGVTQPANMQSGMDVARPSGRAHHSEFVISKSLDKASPVLAQKCSQGDNLDEVTFTICRAKGENAKLMEYKMSDAFISSVRPGGAFGSEDLPTEEVSITYRKIKWTYSQFEGGSTTGSWDLSINKPA